MNAKATPNNEKMLPSRKNLKRVNFWKTYRLEFLILIAGIIFIHAFLFTSAFHGQRINPHNAADFGTFIGGYVGNIFGVAGVVLLIMTLREQSRQYREDGFETRFFQLLDYHRENASEIEIQDRKGARIFVVLIREFRKVLEQVKLCCSELNIVLEQERQICLAYMAFYYGTGPNSTRVLEGAINNFDKNLVALLIRKLDDDMLKDTLGKLLGFTPFEGHQSRLARYFRHLYQMVSFIDSHGPSDKMEYAGMLRAQLSNHEQALLCLNSLSTIGAAWKEDGLLEKYEMIKNLPKDFFDSAKELDVPKIYPNIRFEYEARAGQNVEPNREVTNEPRD